MTKKSDHPRVEIFTDGACSGNPGPGGWAAVLVSGDHRKEISGGKADTTNNVMELTAAIEALHQLKKPCRVTLHSDSQYMVKGMTEWMENWVRRGWKLKSGGAVANKNLWMELLHLDSVHQIEWVWIPAHHNNAAASHPDNARCDELAREAIKAVESATLDPRDPAGVWRS